jgi:hypothetical protein
MKCRTATARLTCVCIICMASAATKPAVGQIVSHPTVTDVQAHPTAYASPWASITTTPTPEALAILAGGAALGFAYRVVKRRKVELAAFCSWFARLPEPSKTVAMQQKDREPPREEEQSGIEKRSTLGRRRGQAKSPLGRQPRLSPQR